MFFQIFYLSTLLLSFVLIIFSLSLYGLGKWLQKRKLKLKDQHENTVHVGIFHPYCNAGGGGERVLWCAIKALQIYSKVGRCSETIMVNSSWTENHIIELWDVPFKTHRVYPPCEVNHIKAEAKSKDANEIIIISVGQFRPEKDHPLQLQAMYELRTLLMHNENLWNKIRLYVVGSCRHSEDYERLKNMQDLCKHLSLENAVEFKVNVSYNELLELYKKAKIGIHTMWNEHFGIGIVECMAAGIIMVAHRSGGPLLDIIETSEGSQNGYLATEALEYAHCILNIISNPKEKNNSIRKAAMSSVDRFSEKEFQVNFLRAITPVFNNIS